MTSTFHETTLNLAAHPLLWGMVRMARRVGPVCNIPGLGVVVSDAEFAREILLRDQEFTKNGPGSFAQALTAGLGPVALGNMDGEGHRRMRAALADVLAPARAETLVRNREVELESMCSKLEKGQQVDIARFMRSWSGRIAFDVLGVTPPSGNEEAASLDIVRLSARMASVLGFRRPSARQTRRARADRKLLTAYFREAYELPAPTQSLLERLQNLRLNFEQAAGVLLVFVIGGTLTTSAALPRILAMLLDNGLFDRVTDRPGSVPQLIDEGLRFIAPLPATVRIAARDAVVGKRRIAAGSRIVILTCNTARDPKLFPNPDQFDVERLHDPHAGRLWFGAGPHRCAGYNLAQRELRAVLAALGRVGRLRIVKRRAARGALLPAYKQLLVQTTDRPG